MSSKKFMVAALVSVPLALSGVTPAFAAPPVGDDKSSGTNGRHMTEMANPTFSQAVHAAKKSFPSLVNMALKDAAPEGHPRRDAIEHIRKTVAEGRKEGKAGPERTVGECVANTIGLIKLVAGERGARAIDTVFKDPRIAEEYLKPCSDVAAHYKIARFEMSYWDTENRKNPSEGTRAAKNASPEDRVALQMRFGPIRVDSIY
ncbi:hypothetical protein Stsp01_65840 [Streptomyces sp. NBRC 13847]|uniref:hypothetical protein n=1 Tax=Streptomyces TaxID=1883 RepID=UPI0024A33C8E|nr:hypothetical protein [Streptomyces sp. NBRC 13847]GLW19841.1 hypothetical protein Stsp01_65840 [Streptomyces sp. NBRC 13847]